MNTPNLAKAAINHPPELLMQAQSVRVLILDVDGVLTDGSLFFDDEGETIKRFNSLDGHGLKLLQQAGIKPIVITGRDSKPLRLRLSQLGITLVHFSVENKLEVAEQQLAELSLTWESVAAMGDDWPDLPVMSKAKFAIAPTNAHAQVLAQATWITPRAGGDGAVRDACDLLLIAQGAYIKQLDALLNT